MHVMVFVAISCFASILSARDGTISGRVVDGQTGFPLPLCNILVSPNQTGMTSDARGRFQLQLPFGEYTIEFRYLGYATQSRTIKLTNKKSDQNLIIKMTETFVKNETVTVWGKHEAVSGVQSIGHKDIRRMPTVYSDVLRSIKILPGVTSNNELSSAFNVRGGNHDENLIYLNGYEIFRPALLRQGVEENQSLINPDLVQNIKLYSGAFPARFGDKLASALEISYALTENDSFKTTVRADLLNAGLALKRHSGKLSWAAGIRYANPSIFVNKLQTTGDYTPEFFDVQALVSYQVTPSSALELFALNAQNKFDLTPEVWRGNFARGLNVVREVRIEWDGQRSYELTTRLLALKFKKKLNQKVRFNLSLAHFTTNEDETADLNGDFFFSPNANQPGNSSFLKTHVETANNFLNVRSTELKGEMDYRISRHLLKVGVQHRFIKQENSQDEFVQETGEESATAMPLSTNSSLIANFDNSSAFVQDNFVISEKLQTNLGVRILHHKFTKETLFSPRTGLKYDVNPKNKFSLGAGIYYQPPFFHELRGKQDAGQLDLKSQKAIQANMGWEHQVNPKMDWQLDIYAKKLDKLIPYYQEELRLIYGDRNNFEGYAYGLDFLFKGEIVPGVNSWLSYSYLKSREREIGMENYKRRLLDQTHTFRFFMQDKVPRLPNMQAHTRVLYGSGFLYFPSILQDDGNGGRELAIDFDTLQKFRYYLRIDLGFTINLNLRNNRHLIFTAEMLNAWNVVNVADYQFVQVFAGTNPVRIPQVLSRRFINLGVEVKL